MKRVLVGILVLACVGLGGIAFYFHSHYTARPSGQRSELIFEVKPGVSQRQIYKALEVQGLLDNSQLFAIYVRLIGEAGKMKVGEYLIKPDQSPVEVLKVLNSGKSVGRIFTIPEGLNIYEISELWEEEGLGSQKDFLALVKDKELIKSLLGENIDSLEGYLFPESYSITKFTDTKQLIGMMVKRFQIVWESIEAEAKRSNLTKHQIVTLASIVEKETGAPEERPLISSVFHNRLKKGMLLQTDPTVIYGKADSTGKMVINITKADLTKPTRYNTYVIKGLPPGPIAGPSKEALLAVLHPEPSDFLYFVSKNQGMHTFSKTYEDHLAAVKKYQLDPTAREGKSWRDFKRSNVKK